MPLPVKGVQVLFDCLFPHSADEHAYYDETSWPGLMYLHLVKI